MEDRRLQIKSYVSRDGMIRDPDSVCGKETRFGGGGGGVVVPAPLMKR